MLPDFSCPKVTVIQCGARSVARAVFSRRSGRLLFEGFDSADLSSGTDNAADWLERACEAIRSLQSGDSKEVPAVLVLPPQAVLLKHWRTPRVDERKRAKIVAFGAGQHIPHPLHEVVWDSVLSGEGATTQDVLLVAAKLQLIEPLCAAAQAAGYALRRIVPASLAMLAVYRLARPARDEPEVILSMDEGAATLVQLAGQSFAIRSVLLGGLKTARPEALAERIASEVTRSLLFFQRQCGMPDPVRLLVAGEGPPWADSASVLEQSLRISVRPWEAGVGITFAPGTKVAAFPWLLAGAAAMQLGSAHAGVNLLPLRLRTQQRRRRRQPWLVTAAVLALATPVGPLVYLHRLALAAETKSVEIDAIVAPLRLQESRNRVHLARLAELDRGIAVGQAVGERRTAWLHLMADLQERLTKVEDVWLERMRLVPAAKDAPLKLAVSGCLLQRGGSPGEPGSAAMDRVQSLLGALRQSPFISAVESERFDSSQPGLLTFEFIIVMKGIPLL